jgi:hypothetical protein
VTICRNLLFAACSLSILAFAQSRPAPVLVELFTSEGCSSCPPADLLLQKIDSDAIVLGFHVDYWDRQGWKDRFSSHAFTERQQVYADRLHVNGPYTPQMVVDGTAEFVGSDSRRASAEIAKATQREKIQIKLAPTAAGIHVEVSGATSAGDLWLALADDTAATDVRGGENKGRALRHVAVVRSLRRIGVLKRGVDFRADIGLPPDSAGQRVVAFAQEPGQGKVTGVALLRSYKPAP